MASESGGENLLYAADFLSNAVFVFDYKPNALKFVGYIALGSTPTAECVDKYQNVWVVMQSELLLEFAHGGTTPIATIGTPGFTPSGCSSDPTTGSLAVTVQVLGGLGAVLIYKNGKGKPVEHDDSQYQLVDCAYDNRGNLYTDRAVIGMDLSLGLLPKGGSTFQYVTTNQKLDAPGAMQWNGKYLVVGDQDTNVVYRFTIGPSGGSVVDSMTLDQTKRIGGFFIDRNRIVAPTAYTEELGGGLLSLYHYPQGGKRISTAHNMSLPVAAVVSRL
jgi:DNA-binding beta-propeller fold protein YncE